MREIAPAIIQQGLFRQLLLVQRAGHRELRVNNVGDIEVSGLTKQLDRLVLLKAVIADQPVDHVHTGEPQGIDQRSRAADRHDLIFINQMRPVDLLAFDQVHGKLYVERGFDRRAIDFTVALGGMPVAEHEQRARFEHRELHGDTGHNLIEIHVRTMRPWVERTDALLSRRRSAYRSEERSQRNLDSSYLAVGHVEGSNLAVPVEVPNEQPIWSSWGHHRGLVLRRRQPETWNRSAPTPIAIGLDAIDMDHERVAWFGP